MPDYPDVLDHLGKTPREFGAVHVHLEPVVVDDRWGWTTVWFQSAFEPGDPQATFELLTADEPRRVLLAAQKVPDLSGGRVQKGILRFKLADEVAQVALVLKSTVPAKAERCRQAWKLFDIVENAPMPAAQAGVLAAGALIGGVVGVTLMAAAIDEAAPAPKVHKAHELPDFFLAEVQRAEPRPPPGEQGFQAFWSPGQALPEVVAVAPRASAPAPLAVAPAPKTGRRECGRCGFSGKREDFGGDRFCPECGNEWD